MRTNQTRLLLLVGAVLCGLFFGLGKNRIMAVPTNNCPQCACKDEYCWWNNGNPDGGQCSTAWETGSIFTHTTNAIAVIYAGATNGTTPMLQSGDFDTKTYPTCDPTCSNLTATGHWLSPQEVIPTGSINPTPSTHGRFVCTAKH